MTNLISKISLAFARTFAIKEIKPCSQNADYKLVIINKHTQESITHYFYSMKDAVKFASPPNLFMGDGYDYCIYNRRDDNKEKFVKLNDTTKQIMYYGCNIV